ncbi:hypothetical protein IVA95_28295 [Bradyrhizobium sp. 157]|uniref:hypothetical protein n=1 Tax=Bradyrhizobium sp. 157 TaxID=2782631 RepID=UPI001FFC18BA|nr:hypothetical protein [Bradyrhizobium sp. 157]MCK1641360.1 hypothetical protein [Bradyrhizobium sp. 157]
MKVPANTFDFARSACEPHRAWIEQQVRLKRNAQAIYQDPVDQFEALERVDQAPNSRCF